MRKAVVAACVVSLVLSGCATQRTELVAAGTDREQLAAAIARRGEGIVGDEVTRIDQPPAPLGRLDKTVQFVIEATPVALTCVVMAPLVVAYMFASGHKASSPTAST